MSAEQYFAQGEKAFGQESYAEALADFRHAEDKGMTGAQLRFALGVSLYKMKRYPEARTELKLALANRKFEQQAQFNLGLVEVKLENYAQATEWFQSAKQTSTPTHINQLADVMLQRIQAEKTKRQANSRTIVLISSRVGYEDRTYSQELDTLTSADYFAEVNSFLSKSVYSRGKNSLNFSGNVFTLQKKRNFDSEVSLYNLDTSYIYSRDRPLQLKLGFNLGVLYVGDNAFSNDYTSTVEVSYKELPALSRLKVFSSFTSISARSIEYEYVQGYMFRAGLQARKRLSYGSLVARYIFDKNARQDRALTENYYSYSPVQNDLKLAYRGMRFSKFKLAISFRLRSSIYTTPNVIGSISRKRDDTLYQTGVSIDYAINRYLSLTAQPQYQLNDSNWPDYSYKRMRYSVGFKWLRY